MKTIVLASGSPRRRELLSDFFDLRVLVPRTDESERPWEKAAAYVSRVANQKWRACIQQNALRFGRRPLVVVAADTIVVLKGRVLGKPRSRTDAERMLRALSGQTHQVITAVCVGWSSQNPKRFRVSSEVEFRKLSARDITKYLRSGEWRDKAGAYGIQGEALKLVHRIKGSLTNIVGLPVSEVVQAVVQAHAQPPSGL